MRWFILVLSLVLLGIGFGKSLIKININIKILCVCVFFFSMLLFFFFMGFVFKSIRLHADIRCGNQSLYLFFFWSLFSLSLSLALVRVDFVYMWCLWVLLFVLVGRWTKKKLTNKKDVPECRTCKRTHGWVPVGYLEFHVLLGRSSRSVDWNWTHSSYWISSRFFLDWCGGIRINADIVVDFQW